MVGDIRERVSMLIGRVVLVLVLYYYYYYYYMY